MRDNIFRSASSRVNEFPKLFKICDKLVARYHKVLFIDYFLQNTFGESSVELLGFKYGRGNISLALDHLGCNITGVDINDKNLHILKERNKKIGGGVKIIRSSIADFECGRTFDSVLISEVLEHTYNPMNILNHINKYVKSGI